MSDLWNDILFNHVDYCISETIKKLEAQSARMDHYLSIIEGLYDLDIGCLPVFIDG